MDYKDFSHNETFLTETFKGRLFEKIKTFSEDLSFYPRI